MANTQAQFGFMPAGVASGRVGNFSLTRRTIAYNQSSQMFRGDPIWSDSNGNIIPASATQTNPISGIFWGCEYPSATLGQLPVKAKCWLGSSAGAPTNAVVTAWIIDDPEELFVVASLGGTRAVAQSDIMSLAEFSAGAGGNTVTGQSSFVLNDGGISAATAYPFRIVDLYSNHGIPGTNGTDNTSIYNWAIVKMNNTDRGYGLAVL